MAPNKDNNVVPNFSFISNRNMCEVEAKTYMYENV